MKKSDEVGILQDDIRIEIIVLNIPIISIFYKNFVDAESISSYSQEALIWVINNGLIKGMDEEMINPSGNATRS